jgi:hypothetical protein
LLRHVADIPLLFQWLSVSLGISTRHAPDTGRAMPDDRIDPAFDPAVIPLARDNPGDIYYAGPGYVMLSTSATTPPVRKPIRTEALKSENSYTPQLYASISAVFLTLSSDMYSYKQRLYYAGQPYDRGERTVKTALKATGYSAIAHST